MGWRPKGTTPTRLPRKSRKDVANRECANCRPPCQGGEVLHRRGHCCHSYCPCEAFEPATEYRRAASVRPGLSLKKSANSGVLP